MTEPSFEQAERELEAIVDRLERGEELYRICATKLETVRGRIEELTRSTEQA